MITIDDSSEEDEGDEEEPGSVKVPSPDSDIEEVPPPPHFNQVKQKTASSQPIRSSSGSSNSFSSRMSPSLSQMLAPASTSSQSNSTSTPIPTSSNNRFDNSQPLWLQRYAPKSVEDLAVDKKRVASLTSWLHAALEGTKTHREHAPSVMALTGPAGCGKTATLQAICESLNLDLVQWTNPSHATYRDPNGRLAAPPDESRLAEFRNWLLRSEHYAALPTVPWGSAATAAAHSPPLSQSSSSSSSHLSLNATAVATNSSAKPPRPRRKVVLIEDTPHLWSSDAQSQFHAIIREQLEEASYPLVIILSDSFGGEAGGSADMMLSKYLPSDITNSPCFADLSFNPVSKTAMKRVLKDIAASEKTPIKAGELDALVSGAGGDIRNAITSLQFYTLLPQSTRSSVAARAAEELDDDSETLRRSTSFLARDANVSLFHGLGKILWKVRPDTQDPVAIAALEAKAKRNKNKTSGVMASGSAWTPEGLASSMHANTSHLLAFLHENVPKLWKDFDEIINGMEAFSLADARYMGNWEHREIGGTYAGPVAIRSLIEAHSIYPESRFFTINKPEGWAAAKKVRQTNAAITSWLSSAAKESPRIACVSGVLTSRGQLVAERLPWEILLKDGWRQGFSSGLGGRSGNALLAQMADSDMARAVANRPGIRARGGSASQSSQPASGSGGMAVVAVEETPLVVDLDQDPTFLDEDPIED